MFLVANKLQMDDKIIVFKAAGLMDKFFMGLSKKPRTYTDAKMTAFTCLLIASKNSEHDPISLNCIKQNILGYEFSREQIL